MILHYRKAPPYGGETSQILMGGIKPPRTVKIPSFPLLLKGNLKVIESPLTMPHKFFPKLQGCVPYPSVIVTGWQLLIPEKNLVLCKQKRQSHFWSCRLLWAFPLVNIGNYLWVNMNQWNRVSTYSWKQCLIVSTVKRRFQVITYRGTHSLQYI